MMSNHRSRDKAPELAESKLLRTEYFTMIELLLVIAVIVILSGLLLPALNTAKAKSQQIKCANNLRQFGYAYLAYSEDNDGWVFTFNSTNADWTKWLRYSEAPYYANYLTRNTPVKRCPSARTGEMSDSWMNGFLNYAVNCQRLPHSASGGLVQKLSIVKSPSDKLWIIDGVSYAFRWRLFQGYDFYDKVSFRHFGRFNALFYDMHCGAMGMNTIQGNEAKYITLDN